MDQEQWRLAPYTEADLQRQIDVFDDRYGEEGRQIQLDAADYVAGVNEYIAEARLDVTKMPGEYAAIGRPLGPTRGRRPISRRRRRSSAGSSARAAAPS